VGGVDPVADVMQGEFSVNVELDENPAR